MRNAPPPAGDLPASTRSAVACLASILELETAEVPAPPAEHPQPWTVWRNWLGGRGLGLVPIRDPATFSWPGPWIAVLHSGAVRRRIRVAAGHRLEPAREATSASTKSRPAT